MLPRARFTTTVACLAVLGAGQCPVAFAQNGTWTANAGGNWIDSANWSSNVTASGSGNTATFSMTGTGNREIVVDNGRTIGNITRNWAETNILTFSTGNLSLAGSTPTITNNYAGGNSPIDFTNIVTSANGLTIAGIGVVRFTNAGTNYTGNTSVTGTSVLDLHQIPNANIGGGAGRNITVTAGSSVRFNALSNTYLNRIVETNDEFGVMTGTTSNNLDFSSTGANLPNAFLGNWAGTGGKMEYSGTLTPASDNYRLGAPQNRGLLGMTNSAPMAGTQGLIVGNGSVQLVGAKTFAGDTVIRSGGRLGLAAFTGGSEALALQNSILDVGSAGGTFWLHSSTASSPIVGSSNTTSAVFGGLEGSRDLSAVYSTTTGAGNSAAQAVTDIVGFTLNVGDGKTATYTGSIGGFGTGASGGNGGAMALTKNGSGTQVLAGNNTYTGATSVLAGALLINGNSSAATGAITVASGAVLGGTGTIGGALNITGNSSFFVADLFDPLAVSGTVSIYAGFGVDDLAGIDDWSLVADGTYTLIAGTLGAGVFDGLANNSEGTAFDIGGGRSAYFQEGSLQLVVAPVPEPTTMALLGAGAALLGLRVARRKRLGEPVNE